MNFDNLKSMKREQLLELAGKQGLQIHPRCKDETIIRHIMEKAAAPQATTPNLQHEAAAPQLSVDHNTPEEVEAAIATIKKREPQFESKYSADENTWHFRCKGAEECGNLDIPLRVIVMKAGTISRGRLMLRGLTEQFDRTAAGGNSAYTNVVIAG